MTFIEVLARRRVPFRTSGVEVQLNCPWCPERRGEEDFNFCLHINTHSGAGHCWHASCEFKGRHLLFLVLKKLQIQTNELVLEGEAPEEAPPEPVELPRDFQVLSKAYDDLDRQALQYLTRRGITREQILRNRIGVSYQGRFAYRIIFPVWVGKELKFINARDFTGNQVPKYLNTRGDKYLFHFNPKAEICILSEGAFKALRIAQIVGPGFTSASLLGHDLTKNQLEQLQDSSCQQIVLWPDPDMVGRKGMLKIADTLSENWNGAVEIVWPVTTPADEQTLEDLGTLLKAKASYGWSLRQQILLNKNA